MYVFCPVDKNEALRQKIQSLIEYINAASALFKRPKNKHLLSENNVKITFSTPYFVLWYIAHQECWLSAIFHLVNRFGMYQCEQITFFIFWLILPQCFEMTKTLKTCITLWLELLDSGYCIWMFWETRRGYLGKMMQIWQ